MRRLRHTVAPWLFATALSGCASVCSPPEPPSYGDLSTGDSAMWSTSQSSSSGGFVSSASGSGGVSSVSVSGDDDGGGPGPGFVDNDHMNACGEPCDIWNWGDCPDGQKCTAVACEVGSTWVDSHMCRDIQGWQGVGEPCQMFGGLASGDDDCELGAFCWPDLGSTETGRCVQFCFGDPSAPQCNPGSVCRIYGSGIAPQCIPTCDPLVPDCDDGFVCVPHGHTVGGDFVCEIDASGELGAFGDECQFSNACDPGLMCADGRRVGAPCEESSYACCTPFCDLDAPNCPGEQQACEPYYLPGAAPAGFEDVGVCLVPEAP